MSSAKGILELGLVQIGILALAVSAIFGSSSAGAASSANDSALIEVSPGEDLAELVLSHPEGTDFLLLAGVHLGVSVTPKPFNTFRGQVGTILDGQQSAEYAFSAHDENAAIRGVTISNLTIRNYATPAEQGTVGGGGAFDWIIANSEISHSQGAGVGLNDGMILSGNYIHHNQQIGLVAGSPLSSNILIEGNEISHNNVDDSYDMAVEAGGAKFVSTANLSIVDNFIHNNHGAGLWTDRAFENTVYEGNVVVDNHGPGIHHEISGSAVIRDNIIEGNANRYYLGGILIAASSRVVIASNILKNNNGGVVIVQEDRGSHFADQIAVLHNDVSYERGVTGVIDQIGDAEVFEREIAFANNRYAVQNERSGFAWERGEVSLDEWIAFGMDAS